jgi:5-methylcytosine-specific restriction endonuclease McrA
MADDEPKYEPVSCKEAEARGSKYYFTGRPCGKGHLSPRQTSNRTCLKCSNEAAAKWYTGNAYYRKNQEHLKAESRRWARENPEARKAHHRNRKARKRGNGGSHTADDIRAIFKAQRGRCAYCRSRLGCDRHVDHIVPLADGGTNDRANLQLLCQDCNLAKSDRDPLDHARSLGMLL